MMHDLFQNRYRIPSARATWHNYNGGIYFVTICTRGQEQYFGEISNGEMHLSEIGHYANEQIRNVQTHYPYAQIPLWVVMPNHLHAIVVIDGNNVPYERRSVETWRAASLPSSLPPITLSTQRLAILGDGAATLFPWGDVVGFHLFYIEWLAKHYSTTLELFLPIFTT